MQKIKLEPKEFFDDLAWAEKEYIKLQRKYPDMWVAVLDRKVVSTGKNLKNVELEAEKKTKKDK
ncbi:MAG: hypothetical protein CVT89_04600 [Candidatus Altiarchaeales archaeon HGW-Altiarchaeales-2]|nr:MAG: hypothetical protein CVT89_04600 [Candidatus Altiarchaeales archaeon HGW-Altiarchaeales-2]